MAANRPPARDQQAGGGQIGASGAERDVCDDSFSPFASAAASQPGGPAHADQSPLPLDDDAAAAIAAAESGDDVAPLPDTTPGPAGSQPQGGKGAGGGAKAFVAGGGMDGKSGGNKRFRQQSKRKLIPLKQVMRCSYEYHGLNDLFFFCITALAVTMVLYWHWSETTATFKATVQRSFQEYGNPDWQSQSLEHVDTMFDAVEYSMGWLEFWLQRAEAVDWANEAVRVGEFGDVSYVRMMVNIDRNCDPSINSSLACYRDDSLTQHLSGGGGGNGGGQKYANLLEWAGWQDVSSIGGNPTRKKKPADRWWSYAFVAPKVDGRKATRDDFIGRMYNVTRSTCLNAVGDCDWANYNCAEVGPYINGTPSGPLCVQRGVQVPFSEWWASPDMCSSSRVVDKMSPATNSVQRGKRFFVRHPQALDADKPANTPNVLDLKPFLSKYAYSIAIEVVASNAFTRGDTALFTMTLQRSSQIHGKPDRILWQITSTIPVRHSFYSQATDWVRIAFEALLYICLLVVLSLQVWQVYVCYMQHSSFRPWVAQFWNGFELLSNITLLAWVVFYWVLFVWLRKMNWLFGEWDVTGTLAHDKLNSIVNWSTAYSAWLYMGIVVDFLICMRIARYMRIHVGLKAFYQVFLIAAREFLDFAVFLFYILVLLGSAVFAFFQLTGGNYQFLRFPDGLSTMSRLTFGFLSYDEFQSQALGLGAAVSAVTLLFWVAVLLLVVFAQNIILAIVAEAYEEAKAKLGTAETSFLMLVLMRLLFGALFVVYRLRMFCQDIFLVCVGRAPKAPRVGSSFKRSGSSAHGGTHNVRRSFGDGGPGDDGHDSGAATALGGGKGGRSSYDQHAWQSGADAHDSDPESQEQQESGYMLAPTCSRAVLPLDVEAGLMPESGGQSRSSRGSTGSRPSFLTNALRNLSMRSDHHSSGAAADNAPKDGYEHDAAAAADPGAAWAACRSSSKLSAASAASAVSGGAVGERQEDKAPLSMRQRWSVLWHDVILGERHSLRMYNDISLAPGEKEDSWVRSWKERYWRPWCVARMAPLRCLMNLYQDFASYKLKESCTWTANPAAKDIIASTWKNAGFNPNQQPGSDNGIKGTMPSVLAPGAAGDEDISQEAANSAALMTFPMLQDEVYVDEDTLARLFLVTSNMSSVLKIWRPPFHQLTSKEVSYLVKGISEVYGVEESALMQSGTAYVSGAMQALGAAGSSSSSGSSDIRDAKLGNNAGRKGGGGFFSGLNAMRRQGGSEQHTRQISWLLHANKRLEEATLRNSSQLSNANTRLVQQMALQDDFQRKQQRTNSQLLKGMQDLSTLLQGGQPAPGAADSLSGRGGAGQAAKGGLATMRRFNSKMFGSGTNQAARGSGKYKSSSAAASDAEGASAARTFERSPSNVSNRSSTAGVSEDDAGGQEEWHEVGSELSADISQAGGGPSGRVEPSDTVAGLQAQLQAQQQALRVQQELLQQVLARLPPPPKE